MNDTQQAVLQLQQHLEQSIIGQPQLVERLIIALLASGNVLLEGLPGTAKTRSVKALSQALNVDFARIQFTPDLLPSDITGSEIYLADSCGDSLTFVEGPLFSNLVLADEINRAPAKVQSALLEAMEEQQVTVAGKRYPMAKLFMVLATQNPIEQEGTYPLPEAQMDRFLMKVLIEYPDKDTELKIMQLVRAEEIQAPDAAPMISPEVIFTAREQIKKVVVAPAVESYIVDLVMATRAPQAYGAGLESVIAFGSSSRASLALDRCARAHAWLHGHDFTTPDDVRAVVGDVLAHRIHLSYEAQAEGISARQVVDRILQQVAVA